MTICESPGIKMLFVGIDAGKQGAIAVLSSIGGLINVQDMPLSPTHNVCTVGIYRSLLDVGKSDQMFICLEECRYTPKMQRDPDDRSNISVMSAFAFGRNYQSCLSTMEILGCPHLLVRPEVWKAEFFLFGKGKSGSIEACLRLHPGIEDLLRGKKGKWLDGRAEAILIAEYGRRKYGGATKLKKN